MLDFMYLGHYYDKEAIGFIKGSTAQKCFKVVNLA